jgi:hypothetical protein
LLPPWHSAAALLALGTIWREHQCDALDDCRAAELDLFANRTEP